ncbi:uncharacterized protein HMPREF1541_03523 [Cyphellophora europaea CBS 101466]|uniref:EthD domain-containing protein n=1 Tax=Cyphellophora europaea (strain CBS 101466) TaxID=1220924 RepID=W2RYR0_CYPE1|nr:uncharacterized protein HMPREF1541_03523 [Cyphellophora europaea CBS 101466]ETN41587.1 hypothetical protein HMPREF1541_03523 [Cyphellophora europaea CBS 101466]
MSAKTAVTVHMQRLYRFSLYVKKRPDITEEEFNRHWSKEHAPLVKEWLKRYGILKYTQYHTPKSLETEARTKWLELGQLERQPWDGVVEITVKDIKDFYDARNDPFYIEKVIADEEKFVSNREEASWTIGWEEVYVKDGECVDMPLGDTKPGHD